MIGALLVFGLGVLREWNRNTLERQGLLRLLLSEIEHNAELVDQIRDAKWGSMLSPDVTAMKTETWRAARTRVAQLLPLELLKDLDCYYSLLETMLVLLSLSRKDEEMKVRLIRGVIRGEMGEDYVNSGDPFGRYLGRTLEAQERARGRLKEFLKVNRRWEFWR